MFKRENQTKELDIISFGVSLNLSKRDLHNNYMITILDYNGMAVVELTKENLKEIKDWIIENEN